MGADRVTYGPPSANGTNVYDQKAIVLDQTNGVIYSSGANRKLTAAMSAPLILPPQPALVNPQNGTPLINFEFEPGALNVVGRKLRLKGYLIYFTNASTAAQLGVQLSLGGVNVLEIDSTPTTGSAANNLPAFFDIEVTVNTLGTAAILTCLGKMDINLGTIATGPTTTFINALNAFSPGVNLTAAVPLQLNFRATGIFPSVSLVSSTLMYEA